MTPNTPTINSKDAWVCIYNPATNEAYDVKIVASREKNGQEEFKVHYRGWSKTKDEWMPASRLVKGTLEEYRALNPLKEAEETPKNGGAETGSSQQAGTAPKPSEPKPIVKFKVNEAGPSGSNGAGPSSKPSMSTSVVKPKANGARPSGAGPSQPVGAAKTGAGPSTKPFEQKPLKVSGAGPSQPAGRKRVMPKQEPEPMEEEPQQKEAPVFAVKDVCLCRYSLNDDRVYKATILEIREKDGQFEYKVHCLKWNPRFDQWFPASRLFKGTMVEYLRAQLTN